MFSVLPLETSLLVTIAGADVSGDVAADLLSFEYNDRETDEADDLRITLMDPYAKWAGSWRPDGGEKIAASIVSGVTPGVPKGLLVCGMFTIDSFRCSGAPRVVEIGAVSVPINTPIRRKQKTKSWEKTTLRDIAGAMASEAGLALVWDVSDNSPEYERTDQQKKSDLAFLRELCRDAGLSVKVTDEQLVVFDQASYEKKPSVATIVLGVDDVISWDFSIEKGQTYKSVTVSWRDPKKKRDGTAASYPARDKHGRFVKSSGNPAVHEYTFVDPDADENGQEFQLKRACRSQGEAERAAKAKLRELNARSVTGSVSLVGDTSLVAGVVVTLQGFGAFDGRFIVQEARHAVNSSGYVTGLNLRRANASY